MLKKNYLCGIICANYKGILTLTREKMHREIRRRPILWLFCVFMLVPFMGQAQVRVTEIEVDFQVNSTVIDPDFGENKEHLEKIISFIDEVNSDSTLSILQITFCGSASPEGALLHNRWLATNRLKSLEQYVRSRTEIPDNIVSYDNGYFPKEYFRILVNGMDVDHKDKILEIIDKESSDAEIQSGAHANNRIAELMQLGEGDVWRQLYAIFHDMRCAFAVIVTSKRPVIATFDKVDAMPMPDSIAIPTYVRPVVSAPAVDDEYRHLHIATNLPAWGLLLSNATLEIDLARRWSLAVPAYYSALNYFADDVKFRTVTIQPELRYWFRGCESSWYAGAHMGVSYFNVAWGDLFRYQDHNMNTPAIGGGLSVGYRLPLGKSKHWCLDLSLGAGAYAVHYDRFINIPNGFLVDSQKKTYVGIDQAAISFSYMFNLAKYKNR